MNHNEAIKAANIARANATAALMNLNEVCRQTMSSPKRIAAERAYQHAANARRIAERNERIACGG